MRNLANTPHIYIDISGIVRRFINGDLPTGIDRTLLAYVQHYAHHALAIVRWAGRYWVLPKAQSAKLFSWLHSPHSKTTAYQLIFSGILNNSYRKIKPGGFLLNISYSGIRKPRYLQMIKQLQLKPIFFVHDLIPITHPEYFHAAKDLHHKKQINQILALATGIIVNSQATLDELTTFAHLSNQNLPPVIKAWLGSSLHNGAQNLRPIDTTYFVILSTIEPRKNHLLLLQLWRDLANRYGEKTPKLVIIGQHGWDNQHVLNFLDRSPLIQNLVIQHSTCSDDELINYLSYAQALLFPSFVEGYGLPLIEALSMNVPGIVSDIPIFREVAQDIPEYIDPLDGRRWADVIMAYAEPESPYRAAQLQRLSTFKSPSWTEHFAQVDAFMELL